MRRRSRAHRPLGSWLAALALTVILAAAGCGSQVHVGRSRTLAVAISEFHLDPVSASVLPGRLTLVARNYGRLSHNLALRRGARQIASTSPLPPGAQARLVVKLRPGRYTLESTTLDGAALGARATLIVR